MTELGQKPVFAGEKSWYSGMQYIVYIEPPDSCNSAYNAIQAILETKYKDYHNLPAIFYVMWFYDVELYNNALQWSTKYQLA